MGAATVATTAANYPELVYCALLVDPPWQADVAAQIAEERATMAKQWQADIISMQSQAREEIIALCRTQNPSWAEVECGPWADAKLQLRLDVFQGLAQPHAPWQDIVSKIECPLLLVTGDPELGAIVTPEAAQEAAALWRNGQVAHISGAGHNIRREQFEKYIEAVTAFLKVLH
jgi:pimeloyl-ACP methyl ester carboxylesterase